MNKDFKGLWKEKELIFDMLTFIKKLQIEPI